MQREKSHTAGDHLVQKLAQRSVDGSGRMLIGMTLHARLYAGLRATGIVRTIYCSVICNVDNIKSFSHEHISYLLFGHMQCKEIAALARVGERER